jgi:hypothetical protein
LPSFRVPPELPAVTTWRAPVRDSAPALPNCAGPVRRLARSAGGRMAAPWPRSALAVPAYAAAPCPASPLLASRLRPRAATSPLGLCRWFRRTRTSGGFVTAGKRPLAPVGAVSPVCEGKPLTYRGSATSGGVARSQRENFLCISMLRARGLRGRPARQANASISMRVGRPARSWLERSEAERVAWSAPGVTKVKDRIVVALPYPPRGRKSSTS